MSWFRRGVSLETVGVPGRRGFGRGAHVGRTSKALQHSVVWAACRLRADLLSLMPVDVFRPSVTAGINVPVATPPVLIEPYEIADGHPVTIGEWIYATQFDLDTHGNTFGVITAVDSFGLPRRIEPVDVELVTARIRGRHILEYRINGEKHEPRIVWHERQFTKAGMPIGLSPIAYSAMQLAGGMSAQEFAIEWFENGAVPGAVLRNTVLDHIDPEDAQIIEDRFKATVLNGEPWVVGKDWEYNAVAAKASEAQLIEAMGFADLPMTRFYGVPADMVDVHVDGSATINYANITQRNLQVLTMNIGPAKKRRDDALSRVTHGDRFVRLNSNAMLAMDPKSQADLFKVRIDSRTLTPDQARAIVDEMPLSEADYAQFERLWPAKRPSRAENPGGE